MISPYILRHASAEARADHIQYFLNNYFTVCQQQLPYKKRSDLVDCDWIWDFEENTVFPLFIRSWSGFCDVVTDPSAPISNNVFQSANFFTNTNTDNVFVRMERHLSPHFYRLASDYSKSVLHSTNGWFALNNLFKDKACPAIRITKNGLFGILSPRGKILVPPLYNNILPFSLYMQEIHLFLCYKGSAFDNAVDVYDINGNQIYSNIGGLFPATESVRFSIAEEGGCVPSARFIEKLQVIQYTQPPVNNAQPPYKTFVRDVSTLRLLPCADEDDGPKRIARFNSDIRFARNIETVDLRDIHDALFPLAKTLGTYFDESAEEIMLSIPSWHFFRHAHTRLDWVLPDLPTHLMVDVPPHIQAFFEGLGLNTAQKIADADLSDLRIDDPDLEFSVFLLQ